MAFRPLRRSIQGSALKNCDLLKKVDQNFYKSFCNFLNCNKKAQDSNPALSLFFIKPYSLRVPVVRDHGVLED